MSLVNCQSPEAFLKQLECETRRRLEPEKASLLFAFAQIFYKSFPVEELESRQISDVYANTYFWWLYLQQHDRRKPKVSIFNPTLEENGWTTHRTMVAILVRDMPFLVDSIRMGLNRRNVSIRMLHGAVFDVVRDENHNLVEVHAPRTGNPKISASPLEYDAAIYMEINSHSSPDDCDAILRDIENSISDVAMAVDDFDPMRMRVKKLIEELEKEPPDCIPGTEVLGTKLFLEWMVSDYFTFLGMTEVEAVTLEGGRAIRENRDRRLGLLKKRDRADPVEFLHEMNPKAAGLWLEPRHLGFSKSSVRSTVHRQAYSDYVTIKRFDESGEVVGEVRIMGLYTSPVYTESPFKIPIVREKLEEVIASGPIGQHSHESRDLRYVLESFPRDELMQISTSALSKVATGIMRLQERKQVRLFLLRNAYGKFISCLVYVPRDLYHTELRRTMSQILCEALGAEEAQFTTHFSDSVLARTHFVLSVDPLVDVEYDLKNIELRLIEAAKTWSQRLDEALIDTLGEERGSTLARNYTDAFPASYKDRFEARTAVRDIQAIGTLDEGREIDITFSRDIEDPENCLRFKLFHLDEIITLSDLIPILENMGVRVIGEHPYEIRRQDGKTIWIHDFQLDYEVAESIDFHHIKDSFPDAFKSIWFGRADSDGFDRLILGTRLTWREVAILRAYARYMKQISLPFSLHYIAETLYRHPQVSSDLVHLFRARFEPNSSSWEERGVLRNEVEDRICEALEKVESLDEDRIVRLYVALIVSTLRTNYFQRDASGAAKSYFSFKLAPRNIPNIPQPSPRYEIFVYSPRVEGVHLRWGRVARGGIRWSDRLEDYRTEILGLVKAQQVKNAVIVPVGAKGGFVVKRVTSQHGRDALQAEGIACYQIFVQGLLDLTDNLIDGRVVSPNDVVHEDSDDPYLVVAADKGTATFSDVANALSQQYGFWLGDAFASGGSIGYDHKKMGITARGAWISVQRHFREIGIDVQRESISVLGIGDMSGDVFGNGMLLSDRIQLVATFNHSHIFLDPNPDCETSFAERKRLFELPRSSWADYNERLISAGGGVFLRSAKVITLSDEVRARFDIEAQTLNPTELISALLRSPVDLIWNGGIGTHIKASSETHADANDKANDSLRVNADELRCRVVCEGGNLGITQLGRIEYCLNGGRSNTDFIDNAAGVNCSDHEVNIKILLGEVMAGGELTEKQRRVVLEDATESVANLVLADTFRQVQAISVAEAQATWRMGEYRRYICELCDSGQLDRQLEFIPSDEALIDRKAAGMALTRPEIALLVSYTKVILKQELCNDETADDEYLAQAIRSAFPPELLERFDAEIQSHRLRREIVATQLANDIVNRMGFTFVYRLNGSTGASTGEIAKAFVATREILGIEAQFREIESLEASVSIETQVELISEVMKLARRGSRWFLRNRRGRLETSDEISHFSPGARELARILPDCMAGAPRDEWSERHQNMINAGVPDGLASFVALAPHIHSCFAMIEAADQTGAPLNRVANVYFQLGESLDLRWFRVQIANLPVDNHWQALARETCLDDLDWQERALTISLLRTVGNESISEAIDRWKDLHSSYASRWAEILTDLHGGASLDLSMCTVALRELLDWAQAASLAPKTAEARI
jgi:glutamate dehydrogenase